MPYTHLDKEFIYKSDFIRIQKRTSSSHIMENNVHVETELLQSARRLESSALAQIYDHYSQGIYRYAMHRLGDPDLAEECVSETFSRFLQALHKGRGPEENLQAYLFTLAHNWIVDQYRSHSFQLAELTEEHQDSQAGPEETARVNHRHRYLRSALAKLTPDQQQVIVLKYLEGLQNEEIAGMMKKPVGAVKSLQHRGLAALQRIIQDEELL
jgi:RNA polymerase sigma-70 factor (ECF subfamily)